MAVMRHDRPVLVEAAVAAAGEARPGRPRSAHARLAVLRAVDDLLVEQGYAAMTMKGIAERAGVGRQTVYRWWSHKAEILMEASMADARDELIAPPRVDARAELTTFAEQLVRFLTVSPAGLAYRALLGEAQHDRTVAGLVARHDPLAEAAGVVLDRTRFQLPGMPVDRWAAAQLIGPLLHAVLTEGDGYALITVHVDTLLAGWRS
jgi:AcrR family transcriptional regulator